MRVSDVLEDAAEAIETYGHNRRAAGDITVGFCAVGAISFAIHCHAGGVAEQYTQDDPFADLDAWNATYQRLASVLDGKCLVDWSDTSPTAAVLDGLRTAAKEARLQEEASDANDHQTMAS